MVKVLVVEDEASIREMIALNLRLAGMEAVEADSAEAALPLLEQKPGCDAAILDVMLPGMNGFSLCETIRRTDQKIGIIILSAKGQEQDKIRGLSIGADDYITKPFKMSEVIARVNAVLRRTQMARKAAAAAGATPEPDTDQHLESRVTYQGLCIDPNEKVAYLDNERIPLTKTEFEILYFFLTHRNRIYSRQEIIRRVWADDVVVTARTIDTNITRLRKKIGAYGNNIETRQGFGYGFKEKD